MKTLQISPEINLKQCLLWQYNNAPALRALILQKQDWYKTHQEDFWNYWYGSVFNLDTADDFGLTVWGEILDFPRQVKSVDGSLHVLTTEQYRTVLKGQMLKFNMGVTAPEVNKWLSVVFGAQGKAYCLDNLDMTAIPFVFEQSPSDEILWLLANVDFLPRPAGVGYEVRIIGKDVFGFDGSGLQPFDQGTFFYDFAQDIIDDSAKYRLSINAPSGASVVINNTNTSYLTLPVNTPYSYTVSQDGYISYSGSGLLTTDTTIAVSALSLSVPTGASVEINGQNAQGALFSGSLNYSYTVSQSGYISYSASGTVSSSSSISVSSFQIIPTPSNSTIMLNGQQASGALFVGSLPYSYTVSCAGYQTKTGSGTAYATSQLQVVLQRDIWQQSRYGITQSIGNGQITVGYYTAPSSGVYTIEMAGGGNGEDEEPYKEGRGGISYITANLNQNDIVEFRAIAAGAGNAGVGMALYVNSVLIAVSGGGAHADNGQNSTTYGGDGYQGGEAKYISGYKAVAGYGIVAGTSKQNKVGACGSYNSAYSFAYAYGGSSYAITGDSRFVIAQTYGVQSGQGNSTPAYFTIKN